VRRYDVMLDVIRDIARPVRLLDFGCGTGHLFEHIQNRPELQIDYHGIDLSSLFIATARAKHPGIRFDEGDVLQQPDILHTYDYVVINGVFTAKWDVSFDVMLAFLQRTIRLLFSRCTGGIAFNTMSKHVDWERDDLFHLPLEILTAFLCQEVSRHFVIRNDYGLYEYTTYVYREAANGR
jgi:SAM-dependent methyltransferase